MNWDAVVVLLAVADVALIAHLRRRQLRRIQIDRVMTSLRMSIRRTNGVDLAPVKRLLLRAT
jgi:hypothetical protein